MKITIDPIIKQLTPNFFVGALEFSVDHKNNGNIDQLIHNIEEDVCHQVDILDVVNLETIKEGRDAYKTYGKDPSRYRLAVESLYRRLAKGNQLYRINTIVDLGNVLSIKTKKSIAVLDRDHIISDVTIRLGSKDDVFEGIGRGKLDISNIPIYEDEKGPFGSVTSDTMRTMITDQTKHVLLLVISFSGKEALLQDLTTAKELYRQYAGVKAFQETIIE